MQPLSIGTRVALSFVVGLLCLWQSSAVLADQPNSQAERAALEQQLQEIERQIAEFEKELKTTTTQKVSLTNKVNQLKKQQASLQLQIKATSLKLEDLGNKLSDTEDSLQVEAKNLERVRGLMSNVLVSLQQADELPLWYRIGRSESLAKVFDEMAAYSELLTGLANGLEEVKVVKKNLENKQEQLSDQQAETKNLFAIKTLQQEKLIASVKEQSSLLQQTKGKESAYQSALSDTKKRAAEIKARIYQLLDVSTQITFGQAYQIAAWVSQQTGVRPALVLAVLTQESKLGRNVGTCNRLGDPPTKSWRAVMKPERDQEPFLAITRELGMDPDVTPVSCPMRDKNGKQIGWGGAMGPAQFIPSTWMGYRARVATLTGKSPANPWDIRDAFVAAAILLKANGADGTRDGEWKAAMRYFSGGTNKAYSFYGDNVLATADGYQDDIEALGK